jgi:hypothetical protein
LNVVRRELDGHRLCQLDDSSFRRAVRGDEPGSKVRVHAGDVNNLSPLAAKHRFGSELRKQENCIELRLNDVVPIFGCFEQHTAAQRYVAGIVHQDADAAEFALNSVQRGLQFAAIGHINPHRNRRNSDSLQFGKHSLILFLTSSQHCDGRARFSQSQRNASTNPTVTTGHDGDFAG